MTDKAEAESSSKDGAVAATPGAPTAKHEAAAPGEKGDGVSGAAPAPVTGGKRARTALSLHEKAVVKSFCEQKVNESKARGELVPSQDQLRREIASKFGWSCGRSTLSKIVSMDWKQLQQSALQNPNMKRQRRPLFPAFEADLVKIIAEFIDSSNASDHRAAADSTVGSILPEQASDQGDAISMSGGSEAIERMRRNRPVLCEALILEEAQRLKQVHGIRDEQLVLSVGWLARFKHRHGIRLRKSVAGTRSGGEARAREAGESRAVATPSGASTQAAGTAEAVNWNAVDPLLLSSSSNMLDALHVVENEGVSIEKGPGDAQFSSTSITTMLEHQTSSENKAQHHIDGVQDDLMELMGSISDLPPSCDLLAHQESSPDDELMWQTILNKVPAEIRSLACRCGCSELRSLYREDVTGLRVVVAGSNSTLDAFVAAAIVGHHGSVVCIDPVKPSLELGVKYVDQYVRGTLQHPTTEVSSLKFIGSDSSTQELDALRATADVVLFNCSLQVGDLSRLERALRILSSLLKPGGELRFSSVCCSRRLCPEESAGFSPSLETAKKRLLHSPYYVDMCLECEQLGRHLELRTVTSPLDQTPTGPFIGDAQTKFYRCTFRMFAIAELERSTENYGQIAVFTGRSSDRDNAAQPSVAAYRLDDEFRFAKDEPVGVDGNTARVLQASWLQGLFRVEGDVSRHRGEFGRVGWRAALRPRSGNATDGADPCDG